MLMFGKGNSFYLIINKMIKLVMITIYIFIFVFFIKYIWIFINFKIFKSQFTMITMLQINRPLIFKRILYCYPYILKKVTFITHLTTIKSNILLNAIYIYISIK